jgi:malonyl-CoA/methylmalonyl-CoA synthetase
MNKNFPRLTQENHKIALIDGSSEYSYSDVDIVADKFASGLLASNTDLHEERIAFIIPASFDYVTTLQGIWRAGGIAIPLNPSSTKSELEHYLVSSGVTRVIANTEFQNTVSKLCEQLSISLMSVTEVLVSEIKLLPSISIERPGMILFTSGTTNKPKGVVITHKAMRAQITCLIDAWEWNEGDSIPLFLPLNHIHGIINILCCALWIGATINLMPKLNIPELCNQVKQGLYTVFMAVPTIYVKLIKHFEGLDPIEAKKISEGFKKMRLNVSGSAACPVKVFNQWCSLTGQVLLERYGMTEIGMALSNPYNGERRAGFVGSELPGVSAQLFDENDQNISDEGVPGEIRVKGDTVFQAYWENEKATETSFKNGWFCTGDIAVIEDTYFRIMGRASIDIIKSGGYKLSALEIEGVLLNHDDIDEIAVIGIDDDTWGEAVAAVVSLREGASLNLADLKDWCDHKMSSYKIPKHLKILEALPRNAMGKVIKKTLRELF